MVARTRSRDRWVPKGTWQFFGTVYGGGYVRVGSDICQDQILPGDNHPFQVDSVDFSGGVCNGSNNGWIVFNDYVVDAAYVLDNWDIHDVPDSPSIEQAAVIAAARTNPSKPYVDLPVSLIELHELPLLLKSRGDAFLQRHADLVKRAGTKGRKIVSDSLDPFAQAGAEHIKYEFGAKPLIDDIAKLVDFQDQVNRRVEVLKRLAVGKEYRRTVRIWAGEGVTNHHKFLQTQGCFLASNFEVTTRKLITAHCRWIPTVDMDPLMSTEAMRGLAKRATLGLKLDFASAWELMPWSWLVDWFGNFGQFLQAHKNHIPAMLSRVTVATHTQSVHTCGNLSDGPIHMSSIKVVRNRKQRQIASVVPSAHFPFLNGKQVGILAALGAMRR